MRSIRRRLGMAAIAVMLLAMAQAPIPAVASPHSVSAAATSTLSGRLIDQRERAIVGSGVLLFDARGRAYTPKVEEDGLTGRNGAFRIRAVPAGTYRLGVRIDFDSEYGVHKYTASASFFWTSRGGTSSFSEAEPIRIGGAGDRRMTLRAPGGVRAKGTLVSAGEYVCSITFTRVGNPGDSASLVQAAWGEISGRKDGIPFTSATCGSTALQPGRYVISSWSYRFNAKGEPTAPQDYWWTGSGKRPATSSKGAKVLVVRSGEPASYGRFDMSLG